MSDAYWREPIKWNQLSLQTYGRRMRVFCASMADVFDNEVPPEWRERLWKLIAETPNLEWILVTKRIGNVPKMVPFDWMAHGFPEFVTLCITVANQNEAERDIYKLLGIPVAVRGLSIEPLLGSINLTRLDLTSHGLDYLDCLRGLRFNFHPSIQQAEGEPFVPSGAKIAWVKVGGESGGAKSRPPHPSDIRHLRDQCGAAGTAFHFKQWGDWMPSNDAFKAGIVPIEQRHPWGITQPAMARVGKKRSGNLLDGRDWLEMPW
jgi:protein gp37